MKPMPNTGYHPPVKPDPRNYPLEKAQAPLPPTSMPASYKTNLTGMPVLMQAKIPDCVENGVIYAKMYHTFKTTGQVPSLSRRFLAILTAQADKIPFANGTSLEVALNVEHNTGICVDTFLADDHQLTDATPNLDVFIDPTLITPAALSSAAGYKNSSYAAVTDLSANGLRNAIYQNGLVLIGMDISSSWWTSKAGETSWARNDIIPIRPPNGKNDPTLSQHIVALYGYDANYFYFVNWWSDQWAASMIGGGLGTDGGYGSFGANDLPYIYEAFTVLDLTPDQIVQLKQITTDVQQVQTVIQNDPSPAQLSLAEQAIAAISAWLASVFG